MVSNTLEYNVMGLCYQGNNEYNWEVIQTYSSFDDARQEFNEQREVGEDSWYESLKIEKVVTKLNAKLINYKGEKVWITYGS